MDNLPGMLRKGFLPSVGGRWQVPPDALFNSGSTVGGGISFWYHNSDKRKPTGSCLEKMHRGGEQDLEGMAAFGFLA